MLIDQYERLDCVQGVSEEVKSKLKSQYENKAFLENWKQQWTLNITDEQGWMSPEGRRMMEKLIERMKQEEKSKIHHN